MRVMTATAAAANCSKTAATITTAAQLTTATLWCAGVCRCTYVCVSMCVCVWGGEANKTEKNALRVAFCDRWNWHWAIEMTRRSVVAPTRCPTLPLCLLSLSLPLSIPLLFYLCPCPTVPLRVYTFKVYLHLSADDAVAPLFPSFLPHLCRPFCTLLLLFCLC